MKYPKKRALISVYHKVGIEKVAASLYKDGWEIISTGGTASFIEENSIPVTKVSNITGFPEILNGRVKTLHPKIFGPILAENSKKHLNELKNFSLSKIDLVLINFYPFEEFLHKGAEVSAMIEKIDIGGPSMVRAAAKNFKNTIVIVKEEDYRLIDEKVVTGNISESDRKELAAKAFSYTSYYDSLISNYLYEDNLFDREYLSIAGKKFFTPRYGENPHQKGSVFITDNDSPIKNLKKIQGKQLSYNNILDISVVYDMTNQFVKDEKFCVIVKHQNPCGAALSKNIAKSFDKALLGDPISAFGGVVGFNDIVDSNTAEKLLKLFLEVIVAPKFSDEAIDILKKKKNLRLIELNPDYHEKKYIRSIPGGFIIQEKDNKYVDVKEFNLQTSRMPNEKEKKDISFGWKLIKFIKSNAILLVKDQRILGVGAGQMSRIDSVDIAIKKAGDDLKGSTLLSDAFFPFKDSIERLSGLGINVVVEPGGSVRDEEVIKSAESSGISLIFTGIRHFLH